MEAIEREALTRIRDEVYRQRISCTIRDGAVPESVLTVWNLVRYYLGEVKAPPMIAPRYESAAK